MSSNHPKEDESSSDEGPPLPDIEFVDPNKLEELEVRKKFNRPATASLDGGKIQKAFDEERFKDPRFPRRTVISTQIDKKDDTEVFALSYSADSHYLAAGCMDGTIRVHNHAGKLNYVLEFPNSQGMPITCIRFHPETLNAKTKNTFLATNADGMVAQFHLASNTCIYSFEETNNQVYACDYSKDGELFLTAGQDAKIRIYEDSTKSITQELAGAFKGYQGSARGHASRIYSAKFKPDDSNIVVSGGWDNTVLVWDLRSGSAVRSIYGPHICGDGIDIHGDTIVTSSWRPNNALELWDLGKGELIQSVEWQKPVDGRGRAEVLYTCNFSKDGKYIAAGGTGTNEAKIFDAQTLEAVDRVLTGPKGCYTTAFSPDCTHFAVGGGDTWMTNVDL